MTNSQQLLDNTKNYATLLADIEIPDQDDEVKKEFIKLLMHNYLGGNYVDFDAIDRYIEQARQNVNIQASFNQDISELENDEGSDEF